MSYIRKTLLSFIVIMTVSFTMNNILHSNEVYSFPSSSMNQNQSNTVNNTILSVTGTATTNLIPDEVGITLGLDTFNKTATAAMASNSETMSKVINALMAAGVTKNEINTSHFRISPTYENSDFPRDNITGFKVSNSIEIDSMNSKNVSKWIDIAITAGANRIDSISFSVSDKKLNEIKDNLLKQAIDNARAKANITSSILGVKLAGLNSIQLENSNSLDEIRGGGGGGGAPIFSGEQPISTKVNMEFLVR